MHEPNNKGRNYRPPRALTRRELDDALGDYPPIMSAEEAARMLGISKSTLYHHVCRGNYRDAVRRSKPLVFWRDRLARSYFRG